MATATCSRLGGAMGGSSRPAAFRLSLLLAHGAARRLHHRSISSLLQSSGQLPSAGSGHRYLRFPSGHLGAGKTAARCWYSAQSDASGPGSFAFAFDIDGVLLRSSNPIPGATETLKYLQQHRIPFIFLSNGGGKPEAERAAELSAQLGVDIDESIVIQGHTVFKRLLDHNSDLAYPNLEKWLTNLQGTPRLSEKDTILVLGSDASKARRAAHGYGFKSVVTPGDILKACPGIYPSKGLEQLYSDQEILDLPKPIYDPKASPAMDFESCLRIVGILVFNDPRDWALDIQLAIDLSLSRRGYLGTYSPKNGSGYPKARAWQHDDQPAIIFSNEDMEWVTDYHLARLGQGAFKYSLRQTWHSRTLMRKPNPFTTFSVGKPSVTTFTYAQDVLDQQWRALKGCALDESQMRTVYMVGDNPDSDIKGASSWNEALASSGRSESISWVGCLVRTGVWSDEVRPLEKTKHTCRAEFASDDVKSVVNEVLKREEWPGQVN